MIGLYGGTFDPPHNGHVALARDAVRELGLADVLVFVVADPGHREVVCDAATRLELTRLAFPDRRVELEPYRFTVDAVRERPFADAAFLIGADEFAGFLSWREPQEILEHVRVAVATRPGYRRELLAPVLAELRRPERVLFFDIEPVPVSSTEVRARVGRGDPVADRVPAEVARVVEARGLYGPEHGVH